MIEEIEDPVLRSLLTDLVSIVSRARGKGLQVRLVGPAAIYLHILNRKDCTELYEKLLARGPLPPKPPVPTPVQVPMREGAVVEAGATIPEVVEDPRALEDELLLSTLMIKSELIAAVNVEVGEKDLIKYVGEALSKQVRELGEGYVYVSIKAPNKNVRLLYSRGKLTGVRVETADGAVLNGREALSMLGASNEVIKTRAYVFKVSTEVFEKPGT